MLHSLTFEIRKRLISLDLSIFIYIYRSTEKLVATFPKSRSNYGVDEARYWITISILTHFGCQTLAFFIIQISISPESNGREPPKGRRSSPHFLRKWFSLIILYMQRLIEPLISGNTIRVQQSLVSFTNPIFESIHQTKYWHDFNEVCKSTQVWINFGILMDSWNHGVGSVTVRISKWMLDSDPTLIRIGNIRPL